ncbi:MAG: undecaprenyl/decaprenyl-phosphate alpha-N-acetylglucosaminyl 1-phosphate transferase [Bacteroidales bacterium]|nr:undecaprenyl/decaprenyl-phosphate alpha-N-acetylglucosaminyl 1-phosphate transferase [Bacteroidales bacterium]
MSILLIVALSLAALVAVEMVYFKVLAIAKNKNLVDNPDARKLQKVPVPVLGGIAVMFGIFIGLGSASAILPLALGMDFSPILPVLIPMALMLYVGAIDDISGLSPLKRLFLEIFAVLSIILTANLCVDSLHGLWGVGGINWYLGVLFTVIGGVGIINALNMIDGVNGLSSGLSIVCCCFFGYAFYRVGDYCNSVLAFVMVGSLLPFLFHNVFGNLSRMFIGDAGTMVLGILMTWFCINLLGSGPTADALVNSDGCGVVSLALAILSVPVFDTLRVMTMRIFHRKSPFSPDKTHLHHAFLSAGMSHFITSVTEISLDIIIVAIWYICHLLMLGIEIQLYIVVASSIIFVWGTYAVIHHLEKHSPDALARIRQTTRLTHMGDKGWWKLLQEILDSRCSGSQK